MKTLILTLVTLTLSLAPCWSHADTKINLTPGSSVTIHAGEQATVSCGGSSSGGGGGTACFCRTRFSNYGSALYDAIILSGGTETRVETTYSESACQAILDKIAACK